MVTCLTIELSNSGDFIPHGAKSYETLPRIGEYVSLEKDGKEALFEVITVAHSSDYVDGIETDGADLYIKHSGSVEDVTHRLSQKHEL